MIRKGDWKYIYFTGDESLLFNLREDPGELQNLAAVSEFASKKAELHAILTSLVNPDQVTGQAFAAQEHKLASIVKRLSKAEFHRELIGRLGSAQAHTLTRRYYTS